MFQPPTSYDLIAVKTFREGDVSAERGERIAVSPLYALILTNKGLARHATGDVPAVVVPVTPEPVPVPVVTRRRGAYRRKDLRVQS